MITKLKNWLTAHQALVLFVLVLALHLWKISGDLPNVYNPDEPHNLNVAAHFSTGDLNPHDFKYPTLWPYLIALQFGFMFAAGKFLGLVGSSAEFARQFLYSPTIFYLVVRTVSAILTALAPVVLYRMGRRRWGQSYALAIGVMTGWVWLAVQYGHDATQYGLLFFLMACTVDRLSRIIDEPTPANYAIAGLFIGLAASTHYIAGPLFLLVPAVHFIARDEKAPASYILLSAAAAAIGFFATSPYTLIDFATFKQTLRSLHEIQQASFWNQKNGQLTRRGLLQPTINLFQFIDKRGVGFLFAVIGFAAADKTLRKEYAAWLSPLILLLPYFTFSYFGGLDRYTMCAYFPLLIPAAGGFIYVWNRIGARRYLKVALVAAAFLLSMGRNRALLGELTLQDSRTIAKNWIEKNVRAGSKILIQDPYHSVPLQMNDVQLKRLYARTAAAGLARQRYFQILLEGYRGGGYEVFTVRRSGFEIEDLPDRNAVSYNAQDSLNVDDIGLDGLRQLGVTTIVVDEILRSFRGDSHWMQELDSGYVPVFEIGPVDGKVKGPRIQIYDLLSPTVANA